MARTLHPTTPGVSVVCVYNDRALRETCLDASWDHADTDVASLPVELVAVDNVHHEFPSAGAALNHGAHLAAHDVVVFVHQDVRLHSLRRLVELGEHLRGGAWGMLGACGTTRQGTVVGTLRDRVQLIGQDAPEPVAVESVDEVLFCLLREQVLAHPLSEDPDLAWHAYAVEYALRLHHLGLPTGAANAAITHHSRTDNLDRLDVAHAHVAREYADLVPVQTTCGVVRAPSSRTYRAGTVHPHAWRGRWLLESGRARRTGRHLAAQPTVLADIRLDVDDLAWAGDRQDLHVVNVDTVGDFSAHAAAPLRLPRGGRTLSMRCVPTVEAAVALLGAGDSHDSWLVTNLARQDVRRITAAATATGAASLLGVHDLDLWVLVGPVAEVLPAAWSRPRAVPLLQAPRPTPV